MIVLLNTVVLFVVFNVGAAVYLERGPQAESEDQLRRRKGQEAIDRHGMDFFRRVYQGKSDEQIRQLIHDQPFTRSTYEPFAEFRNGASVTPTRIIHQAGFRLGGENQGPWPLDPNALNVFVFGASTTLGPGVEDDKTIPARIQEVLRRDINTTIDVNVYNFAVGAFFSSQEVTYFQNQLRYGNVPDMVVFVDGQNEFYFWDGDPVIAQNFRTMFQTLEEANRRKGREQGAGWHLVEFLKSLPIVKLAAKTEQGIEHRRASPARSVAAADRTPGEDIYAKRYVDGDEITDPRRIQAVIARYLVNKQIAQAIAEQFGIEAIFAWQPTPLYKYDLAHHPHRVADGHRRSRYGYPAMAQYVASNDVGANFAWCADVQETISRPLYIDHLHYSEEGNRIVAACIGEKIVASGTLERVRQRKSGSRVAARPVVSTAAAPATRMIATIFSPAAITESLDMPAPLSDWSGVTSRGVRLADTSAGYAAIYEYFSLERAPEERTHRVSIRIKPDASDHVGLVLNCVGGPHLESFVLFVNPASMGLLAATGLHEVANEPGGWTRLTLQGTCKDPGNDRLQVILYPQHGASADQGAIVFGGGEVARVVPAAARSAGASPVE
jgi:hypothetical protein